MCWLLSILCLTRLVPCTRPQNVSSPGKARHIRQNPPMNEVSACWADQQFRDRVSSLLSVDDLVEAVVQKLEDMGQLENTFIIYSSDHG